MLSFSGILKKSYDNSIDKRNLILKSKNLTHEEKLEKNFIININKLISNIAISAPKNDIIDLNYSKVNSNNKDYLVISYKYLKNGLENNIIAQGIRTFMMDKLDSELTKELKIKLINNIKMAKSMSLSGHVNFETKKDR